MSNYGSYFPRLAVAAPKQLAVATQPHSLALLLTRVPLVSTRTRTHYCLLITYSHVMSTHHYRRLLPWPPLPTSKSRTARLSLQISSTASSMPPVLAQTSILVSLILQLAYSFPRLSLDSPTSLLACPTMVVPPRLCVPVSLSILARLSLWCHIDLQSM